MPFVVLAFVSLFVPSIRAYKKTMSFIISLTTFAPTITALPYCHVIHVATSYIYLGRQGKKYSKYRVLYRLRKAACNLLS